MSNNNPQNQGGDAYWDSAGERGYAQAMYSSATVETKLRGRQWHQLIDIAHALGVSPDAHVLDVGCGDGAFANQILALRYRQVDGLDKSEPAIRRALSESQQNTNYRAVDLATFDYESLPQYDAAFLVGILHHIKQATPRILQSLIRCTNKLIVLEPNGNHLLRKALELTPSYRAAGEDSFRTKELTEIFTAAGWRTNIRRRVNLFPNFTPDIAYRIFSPIEPWIESSNLLNALCTVDLYGLVAMNAK